MDQNCFSIDKPFIHFLFLFLVAVFLFTSPCPAQDTNDILYVFDLETYIQQKQDNRPWQYDVINLVSALQGLVNRDEPQLYVFFVHEGLSEHQKNVDRFWLEKLRSPGGFLTNHEIVEIETLEELLETFREYFSAMASWDPQVPATGNLALTIAGVDGWLPIRYDETPGSLYMQIVRGGPQLNPGIQMRGKFSGIGKISDLDRQTTQLPKNDAYLWAKTLYLDNENWSSSYIGYFLDPFDWVPDVPGSQYTNLYDCMIVNHDFYISEQAFFVDLDPWLDEIPTDTPDNPFNTGKDKRTLVEILESAFDRTVPSERMLKVGGFVPWWKKYSSYQDVNTEVVGKHSETETAREFISIMSAFNGVIDADNKPFGSIANVSIFRHSPLKERYFQNPIPPQKPLENKNYLLFIIGDFRSSAMLYQAIPVLWEDMARGLIPITWAITPFLSERVPHIFDYMYNTKTSNDYFVSGNTGPGLSYPNRYVPNRIHSRLGDGLAYWNKFAEELYRKFDLQITTAADLDQNVFNQALVSGQIEPETVLFNERLQDVFFSFSPHGVSALKPFYEPLGKGIVPFVRETNNFDERLPSLEDAAQRIYQESSATGRKFHVYRFNLATPQTLVYLSAKIKKERPDLRFELLDPYSFFYLLRQHSANGDASVNYLLPNYLFHTIPELMDSGRVNAQSCEVTLRNDGWDIWNPIGTAPEQRHRLTYRWEFVDDGSMIPGKHSAYVNGPILPGERATMKILIEAPAREGLFDLVLTFEKEGFRESLLEKRVKVYVTVP